MNTDVCVYGGLGIALLVVAVLISYFRRRASRQVMPPTPARPTIPEPGHEELLRRGYHLCATGHMDDGVRMMQRAVGKVSEENGRLHQANLPGLFKLASVARHRKYVREAEVHLRRIEEILTHLQETHTPMLPNDYEQQLATSLAVVLDEMGRPEEALPYATKVFNHVVAARSFDALPDCTKTLVSLHVRVAQRACFPEKGREVGASLIRQALAAFSPPYGCRYGQLLMFACEWHFEQKLWSEALQFFEEEKLPTHHEAYGSHLVSRVECILHLEKEASEPGVKAAYLAQAGQLLAEHGDMLRKILTSYRKVPRKKGGGGS